MMMKLNLGCGPHHPDGWINADIREETNPDVLLSRRSVGAFEPASEDLGGHSPLPWEDGTFDQILISHVLEHIWPNDIPPFLREVQRVTKTDGQVLIICPDINELVRKFVSLNSVGRLGYDDSEHNWYMEPPMDRFTPEPYSTKTVLEHLFSELVLEDDPLTIRTSPLEAMPHSDHKWNSYGKRLLEIVKDVFPDSKLLGTDGIPEEIKMQGMDTGINGSMYEFQWTDPNSGYVWDTTSWTSLTCTVLANK